jgi:hypothetical protein
MVADFIAGHEIDPLRYKEFYKTKPQCVEEQYRLAAPYLNILSISTAEQESAKEMESLREEVRQLRGQFETYFKGKLGSDQ